MIAQEWWTVEEASKLPYVLLFHEKYKVGKWSFDSAKVRRNNIGWFIEEVIITFREVEKDGNNFTLLGLVDHWKKKTTDPTADDWELVSSTIP